MLSLFTRVRRGRIRLLRGSLGFVLISDCWDIRINKKDEDTKTNIIDIQNMELRNNKNI